MQDRPDALWALPTLILAKMWAVKKVLLVIGCEKPQSCLVSRCGFHKKMLSLGSTYHPPNTYLSFFLRISSSSASARSGEATTRPCCRALVELAFASALELGRRWRSSLGQQAEWGGQRCSRTFLIPTGQGKNESVPFVTSGSR